MYRTHLCKGKWNVSYTALLARTTLRCNKRGVVVVQTPLVGLAGLVWGRSTIHSRVQGLSGNTTLVVFISGHPDVSSLTPASSPAVCVHVCGLCVHVCGLCVVCACMCMWGTFGHMLLKKKSHNKPLHR